MRIKARMAVSGSILIMKREETSRLGVVCSAWLDIVALRKRRPKVKPRNHWTRRSCALDQGPLASSTGWIVLRDRKNTKTGFA